MNRNSSIFMRKHPHTISWASLVLLVICWIFAIIFGNQLIRSTDECLENLNENVVHIDKVSLIDSHNVRGTRMKLKIVDNDMTYYLWYPQSTYQVYSQAIHEDLLSGNVDIVVIKSTKPTLRDIIQNQRRIADIRTNDTVYYDLQSEIEYSDNRFMGTWLGFIIMATSAILGTICVIRFSFLHPNTRKKK